VTIDRMGIHIGNVFYLRFYAMIIIAGAILGAFLASRLAKKKGQDPEIIWDMFPWVLIAGIIGARIWHILTPSPSLVAQGVTTWYYLTHPLKAIAIWEGGLGILGGVIGGILAIYFYTKSKKLDMMQWLDFLAPATILGQAIGRWGNFVNQELYGAPTNLPWKIYIEPAYRHAGFEDVAYYHPTFLYESIWNLIILGLLLWVGNRFAEKLIHGDIFLLYLIGYPIGRFLVEFLRLDSSTVIGININQWIMIVIAALAGAILILRHVRRKPGSGITENQTEIQS